MDSYRTLRPHSQPSSGWVWAVAYAAAAQPFYDGFACPLRRRSTLRGSGRSCPSCLTKMEARAFVMGTVTLTEAARTHHPHEHPSHDGALIKGITGKEHCLVMKLIDDVPMKLRCEQVAKRPEVVLGGVLAHLGVRALGVLDGRLAA
jgi:hypothetical protein